MLGLLGVGLSSENKMGELLEGTQETNILTNEGSLICPNGNSMIFLQKADRQELSKWLDLVSF